MKRFFVSVIGLAVCASRISASDVVAFASDDDGGVDVSVDGAKSVGSMDVLDVMDVDSMRIAQLSEVVVKGVKVSKDAPFAVSNISGAEIEQFAKSSKELPFLFSQTPGVIAWSENGMGIGTTYMRIRGAADSRINVTIDGVQLNSSEDQCVFWANMNSYASLLGGVQIQRGVGASSGGDGAFGGNIALTTKMACMSPFLELNAAYGSFSSYNVGGSFSSGLLWKHLVVDGAYHHTGTDGFMNGTDGSSGSYYGGLTWMGDNVKLSFKNIGNYETMGMAWNGVDTGDLLDGNYGNATGLNSYKDFYDAGLGRYNSLYEYINDVNDLKKGTSRFRMNDGSLWERTTDNYWHNHNILSGVFGLGNHWNVMTTLHYTYGYGYYEELKAGCKLGKFGIKSFAKGDGTTLEKTDFVRRKGITEHLFGGIANVNYTDEKFDVVGGVSVQQFYAEHFGFLNYVADKELASALLKDGRYDYYGSDAWKTNATAFVKISYNFTDQWSSFCDMQYRNVFYKTDGNNDKFYKNPDGTYRNQILYIDNHYAFFNPKMGVNFAKDGHRAYVSFAVSNREPERNNFTDNGSLEQPVAEMMSDVELGYSFNGKNWNVGVNGYFMDYDNQLVQTGKLSDIGEKLTTNIKSSYRTGVELTAGVEPMEWLDIYCNAALSSNKIKNYDEVVEDWDAKSGERVVHYDKSTLAFSPSTILNGFVTFHKKGLSATWHTNFVSRQYLDNTESKSRSLPGYSQSDFSVNYSFDLKHSPLKRVVVGANVNNVFDSHYAASGWVYSAICETYGHGNENRYREIGYMPMAGRNVMVNVSVRF